MEPLAVTPCTLGAIELSTCLQLVLFSNLFWSDIWQDDVSWKQIDMDYLGNTDKQTIEIRYDRTIKFSRWKSHLKIGI